MVAPAPALPFECSDFLPVSGRDPAIGAGTVSLNDQFSPRIPGFGCYNFALYEEAKEYGAVCHYMLPQIDSGPIIWERRFPILDSDTVETLKHRTMIVLIEMFNEFLIMLATGKQLPATKAWATKKPYTRAQFKALLEITPDMPDDEINRRVRATTFPGMPGAFIRLAGRKFVCDPAATP
jgi:methionyl-tRNA formyltransferase